MARNSVAIAPPNNTRILLACEGEKDALFFRQFIDQRALHHLGICVWPVRGNSKFRGVIEGFEAEYPQRYRQLRAILIVADKNDTADQRFDDACLQIEQMRGPGSRPISEMLASNGVAPPIFVLMMPTHQDCGHLESQCIHAARRSDPPSAIITDNMMAVAHADAWLSQSRRDKAWLRLNLAIRCSDPFVPLGRIFSETKYQHLIPVSDAAFAGILAALQQLP
jgi:hypothetical protein